MVDEYLDVKNIEFAVFVGNVDTDDPNLDEWPEEERSYFYNVLTMDGRTISVAAKKLPPEMYAPLDKRVRARASSATFAEIYSGRLKLLFSDPH